MRIQSFSDVLATTIAWFPFLAVIVAVGWVLAVGATNLETRTNGSQIFVTNQTAPTPDLWKTAARGADATSLDSAG